MKKRSGKFYFILSVVLAVAFFGLGFVYSQSGTTLPSSGIAPNPGHASEQILCNGCISNANIASGAAISLSKLSNYGGKFLQGVTLNNLGFAYAVPQSGTGGALWTNKRIEVICDTGATTDSDLFIYGGVTDILASNQYDVTYNYYVTTIPGTAIGDGVDLRGSLGWGWAKVYEYSRKTAGTSPSTQGTRSLYMRADPATPTQLQITQVITGTGVSSINTWTCLIDYT